jgi:hypothetical protein
MIRCLTALGLGQTMFGFRVLPRSSDMILQGSSKLASLSLRGHHKEKRPPNGLNSQTRFDMRLIVTAKV